MKLSCQFSMIAALSQNGVIGNGQKIPWYIPEDLKHFKKLTKGHTIIMGRRTWQSIGRALPFRRNIILSHNKEFTTPDCEQVQSYGDLLNMVKDDGEVFIIGGEEIYRLFLPLCHKLYLTIIHKDYVGDRFFPKYNDNFSEISSEYHRERNPPFTYKTLVRIPLP